MKEHIEATATYLKENGMDAPEIGIILGTGLGSQFVEAMKVEKTISYTDVPNFPVATVEFHSGKLVYGEVHGKKVIAMQGRFHYYEGYSMQEVTFPVRVLKQLGVQQLLISNAAGNLNMEWTKGELMLIDDHINLQPDNPLRGKNLDEFGPRFPDMSAPYDKVLNKKLQNIAATQGITLREGVYVSVTGPNLETRAEYRFLKTIGADAVGMSTVPEVIVAAHMGLPCCAISVLTDDCDPDNLQPANIEEIIAIAGTAEVALTTLYVELIKAL
ncbi:purine-nucleoside phosphorylase [Fulvivirga sp. M361]|uniref:purine-nucleoside phosphorylase n=1 Tax=Fulvivirga sp. M361 TaxID=2594266 RepID=UPI001179E50F|nr:purine-nucleoside phosphorylase [Fulvivirga sp. M361]TRX50911.1 purine-nucleoside phosphorylase [Fulvivirga sp. M361]